MTNAAPKQMAETTEKLTDRLPISFEKMNKPSNNAFLTRDITDFINDYYALDYVLLEVAQGRT